MSMKKNFFKFLLLGVIGLSLGAVSCKDYDDDIKGLNSELAELKKQLQTAQSDLSNLNFATDDEVAAAVAAAKTQVMQDAQRAIDLAISNLPPNTGGGLTEAEVKVLIASEIAPKLAALAVQSDLVALADRVKANEEALALQAAALKKYGYNDFEALIAEIEGLDAGTVTSAELAALAKRIEEIEPKLNLLSGVLGSLKSLYYIPTWKDNGNPAVAFLYLMDIEKGWNKGEFALSSTPEMSFRVNPTNASVKDIKWDFLNRTALVTRAAGDQENLIDMKMTKLTVDAANGEVKFKAFAVWPNRLGDLDGDGVTGKNDGQHDDYPGQLKLNDLTYPNDLRDNSYIADFIWLRAQDAAAEDKTEIVSNDIKVWFKRTYAFIGDSIKYKKDIAAKTVQELYEYDYSRGLRHLQGYDDRVAGVTAAAEEAASTMPGFYPMDSVSHYIPYATRNGNALQVAQYKMDTFVFSSVWDIKGGPYAPHDDDASNRITMAEAEFTNYYYKYTNVNWEPNEPNYQANNDPTNQSAFIKWVNPTADASVSLDGLFEIVGERAALNRLPIIKVELYSSYNHKLLARHWVKFQITDVPLAPITPKVVDLGEIPYLDLYASIAARKKANADPGKPGVPAQADPNGPQYYETSTGAWDHKYLLEADAAAVGKWDVTDATKRPNYLAEYAKNLDWTYMNFQVYQKIGLSHDEFLKYYNVPVLNTEADGHKVDDPNAVSGKQLLADKGWLDTENYLAGPNSGTVPSQLYIHPETRFGAHTWNVTFAAKPEYASRYPSIVIPVTFKLTPPAVPQFRANYVEGIGSDPLSVTKGKFMVDPMYENAGEQYYLQATLAESFESNMRSWTAAVVDVIVPIEKASNPMEDAMGDLYAISGYQAHLFSFRSHDGKTVNGTYKATSDNPFNDKLGEGADKTGWVPYWTGTGAAVYTVTGAYYTGKEVYLGDAIDDGHDNSGDNIQNVSKEGMIDAVTEPTWDRSTEVVNHDGIAYDYTRNVYNYLGQDIRINTDVYPNGMDEEKWTFLVVFRSTYENREDIDVEWKFRFDNPLEAWLDPITLKTEADPDVKRVENYLNVRIKGGVNLITPGDPSVVATASTNPAVVGELADDGLPKAEARTPMSNNPSISNATRYGLLRTGGTPGAYGVFDTSNAGRIAGMLWALDYTKTDGATAQPTTAQGTQSLYISNIDDNAYVPGHVAGYYYTGTNGANKSPYHSIFWQNAGTTLLQDKTLDDVISVQVSAGFPVPYATRYVKGDIVLKKPSTPAP